jgi:hypothetical protein
MKDMWDSILNALTVFLTLIIKLLMQLRRYLIDAVVHPRARWMRPTSLEW